MLRRCQVAEMTPETAHTIFPQCNKPCTAATTVRTVVMLPLAVRPTHDNREGGLTVEQVWHTARMAPQELPIQFADWDA